MQNKWQPASPFEAIIFDCDSTLSEIEGIDVLAKQNGVFDAVHALTEKAMATTGVTETLYAERLNLIKPMVSQMQSIVEAYWQAVTLDVAEVIASLQKLNKAVYVVSAGLYQPVVDFVAKLKIPESHVYAVQIYFNEQGEYTDFDKYSVLVGQTGKSQIVNRLREKHKTIAHVGDGMNDVEAAKVVDRFIGYGGAHFRQSILNLSDFYICSKSITPLLPLLLTEKEATALDGQDKSLYNKGLNLIEREVVIKNKSV